MQPSCNTAWSVWCVYITYQQLQVAYPAGTSSFFSTTLVHYANFVVGLCGLLFNQLIYLMWFWFR